MNTLGFSLQIGDILTNAKLVQTADLTNAVQVANRTGLPAERVLVMLGLVTTETVQATLQAQQLVRARKISAETAAKAVSVVASYRVDLDRALEHIGSAPAKKADVNQLGELLFRSGLMTKEGIADALKTSQHLSLPLGRILVLKNILTEQVVEAALNAQILMRDGAIDFQQAVMAMRAASTLNHASIEDCLISLGVAINHSESVRIGELFVMAGMVDHGDLMTALEISLMEGQEIGQSLIQFGFIDEQNLESALELQQMINNESLSVEQAVEVLKKVVAEGTEVVLALPAVSHLNVNRIQAVDLAELLHHSGLVSQEATEKALAISYASKLPFNEMLLKYNMIEEAPLQVAIRCHLLMVEGTLTSEQAIFTLHQCKWTGATLNDVLTQMGWMQEPEALPLMLAA